MARTSLPPPSRIEYILFTAALAIIFFATACSSNPTGKAVTHLAFVAAVNYAVDEKDVDPQKIVDHMQALQDLLEGDPDATVDALADALVARIDFDDMDAAQATFIRSLIPILSERAKEELERRNLPSDTAVAIAEVLGWIEDAARLRA